MVKKTLSMEYFVVDDQLMVPDGVSGSSLAKITRPSVAQAKGRPFKSVPEGILTKVYDNRPLDGMPQWDFDATIGIDEVTEGIGRIRDLFIGTHFRMLLDLGVTENTTTIDGLVTGLPEERGVRAHVDRLFICYRGFIDLFDFLIFSAKNGRLNGAHFSSVSTICNAYIAMSDVGNASRVMRVVSKITRYNRIRYVFDIPSVMPISHLPDLLLAMPVTFLGVNGVTKDGPDGQPSVSRAIRMISDLVGSRNFAIYYQLYNRRDRPISLYRGPDAIPVDYLEIRNELTELVDLEMIATPYHHLATREWSNLAWVPNPDPVALGLFSGIPFIVIMRRWSSSGIFPMLPEMIGDTIAHLQSNKGLLEANIRRLRMYQGGGDSKNERTYSGAELAGFVDEILAAFEEGKVFEFLKS